MADRSAPLVAGRIPPDLLTKARTHNPELADMPTSSLLRIALAILAGMALGKAIEDFGPGKPGPKPRKHDALTSV